VESEAFVLWFSPAGAVQGTACFQYALETVHDVFGGYLVCGGTSFLPHARPGAGRVPTSSSGLRVQGCHCTTSTLPPQLLLLASKAARRSAIPAARCATAWRLQVIRSHPGVAPWFPHGGLAIGEEGRGHEFLPSGAILRQVRIAVANHGGMKAAAASYRASKFTLALHMRNKRLALTSRFARHKRA